VGRGVEACVAIQTARLLGNGKKEKVGYKISEENAGEGGEKTGSLKPLDLAEEQVRAISGGDQRSKALGTSQRLEVSQGEENTKVGLSCPKAST